MAFRGVCCRGNAPDDIVPDACVQENFAPRVVLRAILTASGGKAGGFFGRTDGTCGTSGTDGTRMRRNPKIFLRTHPYPSVLPFKKARVVGLVRYGRGVIKHFFHPQDRRAGAAPRKTSRKKAARVSESRPRNGCFAPAIRSAFCPISPGSPISPGNAPAAPFERSSRRDGVQAANKRQRS